jgi:hypothetical protein
MAMLDSSGLQKESMNLLILGGTEPDSFRAFLGGASLISEVEFLRGAPDLSKTVSARSRPEQIFTLGPAFALRAMAKAQPGEWVVYCDADLFFYSPLDDILAPFTRASAVIVPHRHYPHNKRRLSKYGEFNVGLVAFRNDPDGRRILNYWADACRDWCRDSAESGKYADQKYLEHFGAISPNLEVDRRIGANVAPWNASFKRLSIATKNFLIDGSPILYAHMQGLRRYRGGWTLGHLPFLSLASKQLRDLIYLPYLGKLEDWAIRLDLEAQASSRVSFSSRHGIVRNLLFLAQVLFRQYIPLKRIDRDQRDSPQ